MAIEPRPLRTSSPLPPYRAVLAVDAEKYTHNGAYHQQVLSASIPTVLEEAFNRAGLTEVWRERRFPQSSGDGYVIGFRPEHLPFLVHPFLGHLQEALEDLQPGLAAHERELRLRLRVSIDVGPLPDSHDNKDPIDGIRRAMNDTHRLLDADPVRDELRLSDPEITFLVAIISGRVFEEAVLGRFVGLSPRRFSPVDVDLPAKGFRQDGYLYVPVSSRASGRGTETTHQETAESPTVTEKAPGKADSPPEGSAAQAPGATINRMRDNRGQAVQGGSLKGGIHGDFRGTRDA